MEYSKAFFDCLTALRRQLRQEQGLTIRLDEPDALPRMLVASLNSAVAETRELGERLAAFGGIPLPPELSRPTLATQESGFVSREFLASANRYVGPLRG